MRTGFEPGMPGRKANTITTELKRILPNALVRYRIQSGKQPYMKEWSLATPQCPAENYLKKEHYFIPKIFRNKGQFKTKETKAQKTTSQRNGKILDWSKLKVFADNKFKLVHKLNLSMIVQNAENPV